MASVSKKAKPKDHGDDAVLRFILACREESKQSKNNRMLQNQENWDVYHMRHDFRHKIPGQSRETLPMQPMAVETTSSFFQQALVDMGDAWWSAEAANRQNESKLKIAPRVIQAITENQLTKANFFRHVGLGVKDGLLGSVIISKIHGDYYNIPKYVAEKKKGRKYKLSKVDQKAWRLALSLISPQNYYPDPTSSNLYEIEDMYMDYHEMMAMAEGEDAVYDADVCEQVTKHTSEDQKETLDRQRRTNENDTNHAFRGRVKITEFWGTILDEDGLILHENCVCTVANDKWIIRPPTPNPLWHQESPYVVTPLLDINDAKWPKALADAGSKLNIASNELFNLMLDGALRAVNGVSQVRSDWLEDASQVEGGIPPGTALLVNSQCPPGSKAMEMIQTGNVPTDSLQISNLLGQEFNRAMLTSDIRSGITPKGDTSATQVVETSQTITSVFKGMTSNVETNWAQPLLRKAWMTCMQNSDDMDEEEIRALLTEDDADNFLKLSPEQRFAETVQGVKFRVFGLSLTLQKSMDFRKKQTLLQTIAGSEVLLEEFVKKFSFSKLLLDIMRDLGIDTKGLEISQDEQEKMAAPPAAPGAAAPGSQPDQMSQTQSPNTGSQADQMGSAAGPQIPHSNFPPSRATPAGGPQ